MASDTFSQYLAQARAARGLDPNTGAKLGGTSTSANKGASFQLSDVQKEKFKKAIGSGTQQNLDPLSRLVAGLSTPLYAITNIPNQVLTEINKAQDAAKAGRQFDIMGAIGNIATAPVRGLGAGLATALGSGGNVDDMASGSNLIEKATDVIGKASDSNYQDVANNANTVAAGIGGFGLDVLLDPLTYATLGGSAAIKAGELGAKAAEAGATEAAKVGAKSLAANPLTYASLGALPASRGIAKGASALAGMAKGAVSAKLGEEAARLAAASRLAEDGTVAAGVERQAAAQATGQNDLLDQLATEQVVGDVTPTHTPTPVPASSVEDVAKAAEAVPTPKAPTVAEPDVLAQIPEFASSRAAKVTTKFDASKPERSVLEATRALMSNLRTPRSTFGRVLEKPQWIRARNAEVERIQQKVASKVPLTAEEDALRKSVPNANMTDNLYGNYLRVARESGGYADIYGRRILDPAAASSMKSWLGYKKASGNEAIAKVGKKMLTATDVEQALVRGSKTYTKEERASIKAQADAMYQEEKAAMDAAATPVVREGTDLATAFLQQTSKAGSDIGAAWNNALGADFVKNLRNTGLTADGTQERLLQRLNIIENLVTDPAAIDNMTREVIAADTTTKQFFDRLAQVDPVFADLPSYNLGVRQAISHVNDVARKAMNVKALKSKDDMRQYLAVMYPTAPAHTLDDVATALAEWAPRRLELKDMPFHTEDEFITRSEELIGEGLAFRSSEMNQFDSKDLFVNVFDSINRRINKLNLFGAARADMFKAEMMAQMAIIEHMMDGLGIPFVVRNFDNIDKPVHLLSATQLIAAIDKANPALANKLFFNASTAAPITRVFDAVVASMQAGKKLTRKEFDDIVTGEVQYQRDAAVFKDASRTAARLKKEPKGFREGGSYNKPADKKTGAISDTAQSLRDEFWAILPSVAKDAKAYHTANFDAFTSRFGKEWQQLTNKHYEELAALASDITRVEDAVRVVHQLRQIIEKDGIASGALNLSKIRALEDVVGAVPGVITRVSKAADNGAKAADAAERGLLKLPKSRKKPVTVEKIDEVRSEAAKPHKIKGTNAAAEEAGKVFDEAKAADPVIRTESETAQESMKAAVELDGAVARRIAPLTTAVTRGRTMLDNLAEKFNPFYKRGRLEGDRHSAVNTMYEARNVYKWKLSGIATTHTTEDISQVFSDIQHGLEPTVGKEDLYKSLLEVIDEVHATGAGKVIKDDAMLRDADSLEKINDYLVRAGLKEHVYDKGVIADLMQKNPEMSFAEAASRSWMVQSITDPMEYLARRQYALLEMAMHEGIANRFLALVTRNGWISEGPAAGYISAGELANRNYLYQFLPKNAHIDARLMEELDMVDRVLQESRTPSGALGEFVDKVYTPFLGIWKSGVTYMRPGHHFRNQFGAMTLQYFANGLRNMHRANMMALKVIGTNKTYEGFDIYASLRAAGEVKKVLGGDVMFKTPFGDLTNNQIYEAAQRFGLMPTIAAAEDVIAGSTNKLADILKKGLLQDSKYEKVMSKASELRDHHNRLSSFIQILLNEKDSGKFKSLEDLMAYAATRTKKFNPDSNMLTPFEARNMRLVFPFYTWFRGILPAIAETTFMRPGRFMVFPKASYALAYSMGINPDSLYDPFPQDQMFPSFLKDQIQGPVAKVFGNYVGFNPGVATFDVLNTFGADPVHGIAGMVTPFVRVPAELMGGTQWSTQSKIKDMSDYIDAQIPGAGYIGSITGYSPTGTIGGLLTGQGPQETYQQAAGNSSTMDKMFSAGNWLTGLGLQDYSKPSYINLAEIEKRNQAAQQQNGK